MKRIRRWALLFGVPVLALTGVIVTNTPAQASSQGVFCTTFGVGLCTGTNPSGGNLYIGKAVASVGGSGRTWVWTGGGAGTTGTLHTAASPYLCMKPTSASNFNIILADCGDAGVSWKKAQGPSTFYFISVRYANEYLTAFDCTGCILAIGPHPFPGGGEQQWSGPSA